jgi:hypothetical protein
VEIQLDEGALLAELAPLLDAPRCRAGLRNLAGDPFFVAFFLTSVSQGEGLGEAAVGMIGQDELAARIRDLPKQEREERGHKERTIDAARDLFPEWFAGDAYRFPDALQGRTYYVEVLERNRERLRAEGRYSRLNLYLTTTFAYEIMVLLLYRAVADAVRSSPLPAGGGTRRGRGPARGTARDAAGGSLPRCRGSARCPGGAGAPRLSDPGGDGGARRRLDDGALLRPGGLSGRDRGQRPRGLAGARV